MLINKTETMINEIIMILKWIANLVLDNLFKTSNVILNSIFNLPINKQL
jgi:hypothetical protein